MDIKVGAVTPITRSTNRQGGQRGVIEARLLATRAPRRRGQRRQDGEERRAGSAQVDPPGGRVLVLMVPDGKRLPADLADGGYRVLLRLVKTGE